MKWVKWLTISSFIWGTPYNNNHVCPRYPSTVKVNPDYPDWNLGHPAWQKLNFKIFGWGEREIQCRESEKGTFNINEVERVLYRQHYLVEYKAEIENNVEQSKKFSIVEPRFILIFRAGIFPKNE